MSVFLGVTERNGEFYARITRNGKMFDLGQWCTEREAANAYLLASNLLDVDSTLDRAQLLFKVLKGL